MFQLLLLLLLLALLLLNELALAGELIEALGGGRVAVQMLAVLVDVRPERCVRGWRTSMRRKSNQNDLKVNKAADSLAILEALGAFP